MYVCVCAMDDFNFLLFLLNYKVAILMINSDIMVNLIYLCEILNLGVKIVFFVCFTEFSKKSYYKRKSIRLLAISLIIGFYEKH
jgi:hypothetical protein